jgi:cell division septal protein FtsQ
MWFWVCFLLALLFFLIAYFLLFFEGLQINNVLVKDNIVDKYSEIKNIALENALTDIINIPNLKFSTKNILLVDISKIKKNILENYTLLKEVKIKRIFPQSLSLEIIERQPVNIFCQENDCFLLDIDGVMFKKISSDSKEYVVIKSFERQNDLKLSSIVFFKEQIKKIQKIQKFIENELKINLKEIFLAKKPRLNVTTNQGLKLYFDLYGEDNVDLQIQKLDLLIKNRELEGKDVKYIDLRPENRAIICDNLDCAGN